MGRLVDENYFPVEEYNEPKTVTNYDRIMAMSVDELAVMITTLIHERDVEIQKQLSEKYGLETSLVELSFNLQTVIHKAWLESEVDTE